MRKLKLGERGGQRKSVVLFINSENYASKGSKTTKRDETSLYAFSYLTIAFSVVSHGIK
jgi:hypothetical protein